MSEFDNVLSAENNRDVRFMRAALDEARAAAVQDPDVHRYWMKLPELGTITTIYEELEPVFSTQEGLVEDILESGA